MLLRCPTPSRSFFLLNKDTVTKLLICSFASWRFRRRQSKSLRHVQWEGSVVSSKFARDSPHEIHICKRVKIIRVRAMCLRRPNNAEAFHSAIIGLNSRLRKSFLAHLQCRLSESSCSPPCVKSRVLNMKVWKIAFIKRNVHGIFVCWCRTIPRILKSPLLSLTRSSWAQQPQ